MVVVLAAVLIAARISVNYYVITPGDASPVSQYIEVPAADNHPLTGKILLTDVFVTQLNALNYLQYRYFDSDSEVISGPELLGPTPNESQFLDQGYLQMAQAQTFATAAALSRLGYTVTSTNAGALDLRDRPSSPAAKTLQVAQVITAVNGTPTTTDCALIHALHGLTPGRGRAHGGGVLHQRRRPVRTGPTVTKSVTLGTPPKGLVDTGCGPPTKPTAYLGIDPQTQQDWHFPVKVTVHTQDIGGPSAGLAMTLGIIDKLSSGRLTGNRIVAATGTIDQYGNVGDVGGVAEKTIAVERAGATVFFVPDGRVGGRRVQGDPAAPRLRGEEPGPGPAHPRTPRGQGADQPCAGPGGAVGSGHGRRPPPHLIVPDRDRATSPSTPSPSSGGASTATRCAPTSSRSPAASRRSRSARRSCGPPWPRPRSGRPTRWSTRPP